MTILKIQLGWVEPLGGCDISSSEIVYINDLIVTKFLFEFLIFNFYFSEAIFPIYRISFMYYVLIGVIIVMIVGTCTSFIFGASNIDEMDSKLFVPPIAKFVENRQKSKRTYYRSKNGVQMEEISMLNKH